MGELAVDRAVVVVIGCWMYVRGRSGAVGVVVVVIVVPQASGRSVLCRWWWWCCVWQWDWLPVAVPVSFGLRLDDAAVAGLVGKVGQVRGDVKLALALAACLFVVRIGRRMMVMIGIAIDDGDDWYCYG